MIFCAYKYLNSSIFLAVGKGKDTSRTCNCPKCVEKRVKKLKLEPKSTFLRIARYFFCLIFINLVVSGMPHIALL